MSNNTGSVKPDLIIKGNEDITDAAQAELRRALEENELRRRFPEYFADVAKPSSTSVVP